MFLKIKSHKYLEFSKTGWLNSFNSTVLTSILVKSFISSWLAKSLIIFTFGILFKSNLTNKWLSLIGFNEFDLSS